MVTGRYSAGLVRELENETENVSPIFEAIAALEGAKTATPSRTKEACPFDRGKWLKGLWHVHYTQAQFMRQNLELHWKPVDRLKRLIKDSFDGRELSQAIRDFSKGFVEGYLQRGNEKKLTGEWVVFAKQDGVNYYLTLGTHKKEDEAIWRRCKACAPEFPGLRIIQEDR
jgi:hypothetical protein